MKVERLKRVSGSFREASLSRWKFLRSLRLEFYPDGALKLCVWVSGLFPSRDRMEFRVKVQKRIVIIIVTSNFYLIDFTFYHALFPQMLFIHFHRVPSKIK